ncbi:uncharacterized protein CTHT_0061000 [Thermochaetoides thermophila DSM 1495]|uniref:Vezatin n=1 Tax=Chaetomium thermophilum (strain DSM 1495 / CBS 144.50 / IMI 039719) TaxID=759272 RepID=G0SF69_CHATD|nr:hypothetical protein CTHT_0061000 [Thermochaetoides thermophila DSM 1495]EGS18085.1 hypothetical protein CTHT_0061000 [Thermochaetoides thermophila DSM 1495]
MADEGEEQPSLPTPSVSDDPGHDESPPSSPSFAPVGRPMVKKRFRPSSTGLFATAAAAVVVAWVVKYLFSGGLAHLTKKRVAISAVILIAVASVSHAYLRQQWLRYLRNQALNEVTIFVSRSQEFDSASSAAISLIQEVELVSRGYRISAPLPPISRIEDRSQSRRCSRLRKALKGQMSEMIENYMQVTTAVKGFAEQMDLEKYHDIYDISDFDISDAMQGFTEKEFEDMESLRSLKIAAARFHTIRKILLCSLLAFEASGDNNDYLRWSTAVEGLKTLNELTLQSFERLRQLLADEETFPTIPETKLPLSPAREKRRSQFMKLNSLSTGIRGLQAKLALLREEAEKTLNEADDVNDVSELGQALMAQYESIGQDLKMLTQAWEEGKAALASGIDKHEKRISSISSLLSPASSLSGLTAIEETPGGGAAEAFKALTGESPRSSCFGSTKGDSDEAEVYEAVSLPSRPRSLLTREERIAKMKEEREQRELAHERAEANRGMLRELEMVINLRPKRATMPASSRISL